MSALTLNLAALASLTASRTSLVQDYVLPGDTHAGLDLAVCAAAWSCGNQPVFVRVQVVGPDTAHLSVLRFDSDGFGTLVHETVTNGMSSELVCDGALSGAQHVVLLAPEGTDIADMGLDAALVEVRYTSRVRLLEEQVLGLSREDRDTDPSVWIAAREGDLLASRHVAAAAKADLFALVCLGGDDITIH
ncbi:MAG: hypothetical protein ACJAYU_005226 [Bradymonadia bacterium]|jgi:hypothetical protein